MHPAHETRVYAKYNSSLIIRFIKIWKLSQILFEIGEAKTDGFTIAMSRRVTVIRCTTSLV